MADKEQIERRTASNPAELSNRAELLELFKYSPIPEDERMAHLGLFINRQVWTGYLYMNELYRMILPVHGVVMEFGVRWGTNLALFANLRGMYEPFNHNQKIIGFDTFEGFSSIHEKDGNARVAVPGAYLVTDGYEDVLSSECTRAMRRSPRSLISRNSSSSRAMRAKRSCGTWTETPKRSWRWRTSISISMNPRNSASRRSRIASHEVASSVSTS